jgi:hypothetical protein
LFSSQLAFSSSEPIGIAQDQAPQLVGVFDAWAQDIQIKGIMAALSTSLLVVAPVLLMLRRWRLPSARPRSWSWWWPRSSSP